MDSMSSGPSFRWRQFPLVNVAKEAHVERIARHADVLSHVTEPAPLVRRCGVRPVVKAIPQFFNRLPAHHDLVALGEFQSSKQLFGRGQIVLFRFAKEVGRKLPG
jgi:hypothetical protein